RVVSENEVGLLPGGFITFDGRAEITLPCLIVVIADIGYLLRKRPPQHARLFRRAEVPAVDPDEINRTAARFARALFIDQFVDDFGRVAVRDDLQRDA